MLNITLPPAQKDVEPVATTTGTAANCDTLTELTAEVQPLEIA
jgi:hypothetical protein